MNAPVDVSFFPRAAKPLSSYRKFWAARFGTAPFLPMSRAEMAQLGWDSCDVVLVTGDAYVDHPSFGMAVIGRLLEAQGFRVGIIAQPDWQSAEPFRALGKPNLFWGVTAGNMDSMINRYTADRKIRTDDAYTPGDVGGKRPDRAAIVYSQRCREAFKDVPIILGGIEGSLRRIAHYDYWSDKVRRSIVVDAKCDLLLYGNAERALVEVAHRLSRREPIEHITDVRGTAFVRRSDDDSRLGWFEIDSTDVDVPGTVESHINPYQTTSEQAAGRGTTCSKEDDDAAAVMDCHVADAPRSDGARVVIASEARQSRDPDAMDCHVADAPRNDGARVVIASEARQSRDPAVMDCHVADAPRNDGARVVIASEARQSRDPDAMDCHVADAPRSDGARVVIASEARQSRDPDAMDCGVADAPFHEQTGHCERSEAIHDSGLHGLPRYARSDEGSVQGPCAVSGRVRGARNDGAKPLTFMPKPALPQRGGKQTLPPRERTVIRLPSFEAVKSDAVLYAHANRVLHLETNPGNARALVQAHGEGSVARDVWLNPPPIPLTTAEMDQVFGLPYARSPHPSYADANGSHDHATKIPAWEMIRFSVNIMRGCFGGCTFCSITEHEGRIIQSRSEESVIKEIEDIRDKVKGFTGTISDLGGPTANMYRLGCKSPEIEAACRKPSCVFPGICSNLGTDHQPLIDIYRRGRALKGVKKILIGSGVRYDLAVQSPEYVKELVQHHVGGYLKIAPEHTESGPLSKMMKPGMGTYDKFKALFDKYNAESGKKQFLIPYFIAAHPGTSDEDMMNLAIWLKKNGFRADQVQTFYPSPMATATAMYHTDLNPLKGIHRDDRAERVDVVRGERRRRLHKAFLRYHDPNNWPLLRDALKAMGRADLIGNGKHHLIPTFQPMTDGSYTSARRKNSTTVAVKTPRPGQLLSQHTGLPPRVKK